MSFPVVQKIVLNVLIIDLTYQFYLGVFPEHTDSPSWQSQELLIYRWNAICQWITSCIYTFIFWILVNRTLYLMCCYLQGKEEKPRIIRRTVARYMMFGLILICRSISVAVMKRFPTLDHIVEAGNPFQENYLLRACASLHGHILVQSFNSYNVPLLDVY